MTYLKAHVGLVVALAAVALAIFPPHSTGWEIASAITALATWPAIARAKNTSGSRTSRGR